MKDKKSGKSMSAASTGPLKTGPKRNDGKDSGKGMEPPPVKIKVTVGKKR